MIEQNLTLDTINHQDILNSTGLNDLVESPHIISSITIPDELKRICDILKMPTNTEADLFGLLIERDLLLRVDIEQKLATLIDSLKGKYKTSKLNCLHKNRDNKQKFPGINLIRQIFRCNGYHLKPVVYSRGYCKHNGKKIVERNFKIVRLKYNDQDNESELYGNGIVDEPQPKEDIKPIIVD
tara:strand:- start:22 stop:570 length:549 start_codon:yes stop_codon:yes gene_type:complete